MWSMMYGGTSRPMPLLDRVDLHPLYLPTGHGAISRRLDVASSGNDKPTSLRRNIILLELRSGIEGKLGC